MQVNVNLEYNLMWQSAQPGMICQLNIRKMKDLLTFYSFSENII